MSRLKFLPLLLLLAAPADAAILRYAYRAHDSSADPSARIPQLIVADTEAECPSTDVGDGDLCYAKDTDDLQYRTNGAWADLTDATHTHDIDAITGQSAWDTAATKTTADLTIDGVELDFEAGGAEGYPRLAQSTTPPAAACNDAAEAGRLYFDSDADTDGSLFICLGTGGWKDVDDDGAGGGGDSIRAEDGDNAGTFTAMIDADFDDSGDINFTRAAGPPDVLTAFVRPDSVALTTDTTGNYVKEVQAGLGLTEAGSPAEDATSVVTIDHAQTLAGNPALNADECIHVATATGGGLLCEGGTADTNEMLFLIPDLSEADTTLRLVTESTTQTLTNKTIVAADNVVEADTGDSATGFFSAGAIEAARGGTGDDTSATTGVARIAAGNWLYDAGISHLASSASAQLRTVLSDELGSGPALFGIDEDMADDMTTCTGSQVLRRNAGDTAWECATISGGGDSISVNSAAATDADFDDATPAAASGQTNVTWQKDAGTPNNISAQIAPWLLTFTNVAYKTVTDTTAGTVNDWAPTNWDGTQPNKAVQILWSPTDLAQVTGLTGGVQGRIAIITNALDSTAASSELGIIIHEGSGSTAANRFTLPGRMPIFLMPGDSATFVYDDTPDRWRLVAAPTAGGLVASLSTSEGGTGDSYTNRSSTGAGTGASCQGGTYLATTSAQSPMLGTNQCDSGTTATGRAYAGSDPAVITPGKGSALFLARIAVEALSTVGEEFQIFCGLHDASGGTSATDGLYWHYERTTSTNWRYCTEDATAQNCTGAGLAVDTNYIWLGIFTSGDWSDTKFFNSQNGTTWVLNGAAGSQNPPDAADLVGLQCGINKTAGTTQRNMDIDWWYFRYDYTRGT